MYLTVLYCLHWLDIYVFTSLCIGKQTRSSRSNDFKNKMRKQQNKKNSVQSELYRVQLIVM